MTGLCARDLEVVAPFVKAIRLPKVESVAEVEWAAARAPGLPLHCSVESAQGVLAAFEIAASSSAWHWSTVKPTWLWTSGFREGIGKPYMRGLTWWWSLELLGREAPSDGVHTLINDDASLRAETEASRRLGFFGKSAIHPRQVPIINRHSPRLRMRSYRVDEWWPRLRPRTRPRLNSIMVSSSMFRLPSGLSDWSR